MAVLEVHNNLVMVLGVFVFGLFFFFGWLGLFCLFSWFLTDEKFCASERF